MPPSNAAKASAGEAGNDRTPVPRQLPAWPSPFAGRAAELAELGKTMDARSDAAATVVISAIGGIGGIGKTWLALRWAHDNVDRFPDGQLYVNLRGFDPAAQPVPPAVAMRGFLDALGVEPARIPADPDAQAGLYRSLVAGRRMLIVLDNARDTSTVVPLLPGTASCAVLVTSRHQLAVLVSSHGARPLALDVLSEAEARELLTGHLGADRAVSEQQAVATLLRHCAGLPLALGITATRAALQPGLPLAALAVEIETATSSLDAFDAGELAANLRAVLASSIQALPAATAGVFVLLGPAPGPDIGLFAVASLTGVSIARARLLMRQLVNAYLVQEHVPGRYRMHDLVRLHAIELAGADEPARDLAVHRILDHYLHTAHAAGVLLYPHREPITVARAVDGVQPEYLADHDEALAWLDCEYPALLAAVNQAAATGFDSHAWQLAWNVSHFLNQRGYWHHQSAAQLLALDAARRAADGLGEARIHAALGRTYGVQGRYRDAVNTCAGWCGYPAS